MRTSESTRSGVEREPLRERSAGRDADDVCRGDAVGVEHACGVGHQVAARVPGMARLVGDRSAGVAMVVTDHEPPAVGEPDHLIPL